MKWNAWTRVVEVGEGPPPVRVVLQAEAHTTVDHGTHESYELSWYDRAEGLQDVEIRLTLNYVPSFSVGDRVYVSGGEPEPVGAAGP